MKNFLIWTISCNKINDTPLFLKGDPSFQCSEAEQKELFVHLLGQFAQENEKFMLLRQLIKPCHQIFEKFTCENHEILIYEFTGLSKIITDSPDLNLTDKHKWKDLIHKIIEVLKFAKLNNKCILFTGD